LNKKIEAKYKEMEEREVIYESYKLEDAEIVFVAYGTVSRITKNAIDLLEKEGIKAGLIRPVTLWPFPNKAFAEIPATAKVLMSVEMSQGGQMIDDVKIANEGRLPIGFYGRSGGMVPTPQAIVESAKELLGGVK